MYDPSESVLGEMKFVSRNGRFYRLNFFKHDGPSIISNPEARNEGVTHGK